MSPEATKIGDYEVTRLLGDGRVGSVYVAATPPRLLGSGATESAEVVVKAFRTRIDDERFARVSAELIRIAGVTSPNLLRLIEAGRDGSRLFCVMELVPEGPLGVPATELTPEQSAVVISAVADAARGVHALHEAGIAHANLKPNNILCAPGGAKVSDPALVNLMASGQTTSGARTLDSIEYTEPDIVAGRTPSRASDVWSLAAVLHRALTGQSVHRHIGAGTPRGDVADTLRRIRDDAPRTDAALAPDLRSLLDDCLAPERAARPGTAAAVADRLDALAGAG